MKLFSDRWKAVVFWSAVAALTEFALVLLWFYDEPSYVYLGIEDSAGENLTAILYALAALFLFISSFRSIKQDRSTWIREVLPMLLGCFFIFVAGEEISWGQRHLGFGSPELFRNRNLQGEFNLHNLKLFDKQAAFINQHTALNWFALLFGCLIPVAYRLSGLVRGWLDRLNFPVVPVSFCLFFFIGLLHGQTIDKLYPHWAHTEIKELIFSLGFVFFALSVFVKGRQTTGIETTDGLRELQNCQH